MPRTILAVFGFVLCWPAILTLALPTPPSTPLEECKKRTATLKVGMTRADVTAIMTHDGGLQVSFNSEPYVLADNGKPVDFPVAGEKYSTACKRTFDFRPNGMPAKTYSHPNRRAIWFSEHPSLLGGGSNDIVVKISKPFLAPFFHG